MAGASVSRVFRHASKNAFGSSLPDVLATSGGWDGAWRAGVTPWETGAAAPALVALLSSSVLPPGAALVPGCGSGADVIAMARAGRDVVGADVAPTAVAAAVRALSAEPPAVRARARVMVADVLAAAPAEEEKKYAVIWDYAFLAALEPSSRPAWAAAMRRLLTPGGAGAGQLVTLLFPVGEFAGGPPFAVKSSALAALLAAEGFACLEERALRAEESFAPRAGREVLMRWALLR
jgi:hypothetical protein